jgi:excisionase family DNA binding protein
MCRALDVKEFSNYLNISVSMTRKLIRQNAVPYHKLGNKILFDKDEIDKWWESTNENSQENKKKEGN